MLVQDLNIILNGKGLKERVLFSIVINSSNGFLFTSYLEVCVHKKHNFH